MPFALFTSDRFADHITPPGHPERVERAEVMQLIASRFAEGGGDLRAPREATDDDLVRVHDEAYIADLGARSGRATMLDADTYTSPESDEIARLAAGAVLDGVDFVLQGGGSGGAEAPPSEVPPSPNGGATATPSMVPASPNGGAEAPRSVTRSMIPAGLRRAFAMVRPPGHHAERDRAMGFCLYNNIAVGAAYARVKGLTRVAVVDYDVHHGNGTQAAFYTDPDVLFISSQQFPYWPGTGAATEVGAGKGRGRTLNLPLAAGSTDADYALAFRELVVPALDEFKPELLLVSAGFDAHERDPLAGMQMTTAGYAHLTTLLLDAANRHCQGRAVFVTEGGYDLHALGECLQMVIDLSSGHAPGAPADTGPAPRGQATVEDVRRAQREFWQFLR